MNRSGINGKISYVAFKGLDSTTKMINNSVDGNFLILKVIFKFFKIFSKFYEMSNISIYIY